MNRLKYSSLEDFLDDPDFRKWVRNPSPEQTLFWKQWQDENPDKTVLFREAQATICALQMQEEDITDATIEREVQKYLQAAPHRRPMQVSAQHRVFKPLYRWLAAACVVGIGIIGWWQWQGHAVYTSWRDGVADVYIPPEGLVCHTTTDTPKSITLPDGSHVVLQAHSQLHYPATFSATKRGVFLTGKAFFDVTRNPARPFLVYARETVTRVLGTRFTISAYQTDSVVRVSVQSGKVSVGVKHPANASAQAGVVVTPNQQVVYSKEKEVLDKQVVEAPAVLLQTLPDQYLVFTNYPITDVFDRLEKVYGVPIVYDQTLLSGCSLTANFSDIQELHSILTVICKSLSGSYEEINGEIVIHSSGCQ